MNEWTGNACGEWVLRRYNACLNGRRAPMDCRVTCKEPLYKGKGVPEKCKKNRGISVLLVVGKIMP